MNNKRNGEGSETWSPTNRIATALIAVLVIWFGHLTRSQTALAAVMLIADIAIIERLAYYQRQLLETMRGGISLKDQLIFEQEQGIELSDQLICELKRKVETLELENRLLGSS